MSTSSSCYRCGSTEHHAGDPRCPAKDAICKGCAKKGHFQRVCQSTKVVRQVTAETSTDNAEQFSIFTLHTGESRSITCKVLLNDIPVDAVVDTGAQVNVLPVGLLPNMPELQESNVIIRTWGSFQLPILGSAELIVKYNDCVTSDKFFIADVSGTDSKPLLSLPLCLLKKLAALSLTKPIDYQLAQ